MDENGVSEAANNLLTGKEVAAKLNVSERTVRRWANNKTIPAPIIIAGRTSRWRLADVETYLKSLQTGANQSA